MFCATGTSRTKEKIKFKKLSSKNIFLLVCKIKFNQLNKSIFKILIKTILQPKLKTNFSVLSLNKKNRLNYSIKIWIHYLIFYRNINLKNHMSLINILNIFSLWPPSTSKSRSNASNLSKRKSSKEERYDQVLDCFSMDSLWSPTLQITSWFLQ